MSPASQDKHLTLFLWLDGLFPRRVTWYLLQKGLVSSPEAMLQGQTLDPSLSIVRLSPGPEFIEKGWDFTPADDPLPRDISTSSPCLRVRTSEGVTWIRESLSILYYLETIYRDNGTSILPPSSDALNAAQVTDCLGAFEAASFGMIEYMTNAAPKLAKMRGLADEDRSASVAKHGHEDMVKGFVKMQDRCADALKSSGFLTPGTTGPGVVDLCMGAVRRYMELCYSFDILKDDRLTALTEWYTRFQKACPWWEALEERAGVHPEHMKFKLEFIF